MTQCALYVVVAILTKDNNYGLFTYKNSKSPPPPKKAGSLQLREVQHKNTYKFSLFSYWVCFVFFFKKIADQQKKTNTQPVVLSHSCATFYCTTYTTVCTIVMGINKRLFPLLFQVNRVLLSRGYIQRQVIIFGLHAIKREPHKPSEFNRVRVGEKWMCNCRKEMTKGK